MIAAISPHTLSRELRTVAADVLRADARDLTRIARLIDRLADLALSMEAELKILRDIEAGRELRVGMHRAIDAELAAPADTNVVELGRRK
jgi:hypothetical protein